MGPIRNVTFGMRSKRSKEVKGQAMCYWGGECFKAGCPRAQGPEIGLFLACWKSITEVGVDVWE